MQEARERLGGRIWTSRKWPDIPLAFGASWIHGVEGNPITALADEIQARRLVTSYDKSVSYNTGGKILSEAEEAQKQSIEKRVISTLRKAQQLHEDRSIRQALATLEQTLKTRHKRPGKGYFGTAHGAYLSGLRAAGEILAG